MKNGSEVSTCFFDPTHRCQGRQNNIRNHELLPNFDALEENDEKFTRKLPTA